MKKPLFTGSAVALITPMHPDSSVDFEALRRLTEEQIRGGTAAIVACGTTGEPSTMTEDEWEAVLSAVIGYAAGRVPVIAGTGGNNTAHVIRQAKRAAALGAAGQLCVTPYYNKTTQEGLKAHYRAIADESGLPLIIYNVPGRTGLSIRLETLAALKDHEGIVGLKEASGDAAFAADVANACGDMLPLYSGADELVCQLRAVGAVGTISVLANLLPEESRDMNCLPIGEASRVQLRLMPLIRLLFSEVNPIPVKAAMHLKGWCENRLRLPLIPMSGAGEEKLEAEMRRLGIL